MKTETGKGFLMKSKSVKLYGLRYPTQKGKELKMYSPVLNENLVRTIYRLKRVYKKPMTEIAEGLIQESLGTLDREMVCRVCVGERNNECKGCYLANGRKRKCQVDVSK